MSEVDTTRVAVIGGGLGGLSAALACLDHGLVPMVFESSDRVGGVVATIERDGFLVDLGPNTLVARDETLPLLIDRLGLRGSVVTPAGRASRRYVVREGRPVPVPTNPMSFLGTPLFSLKAKLKLLREPFIRSRGGPTETVADFVRRRLGREVLDYAVDPFTGGVFAGDPERLLIAQSFPRLAELERCHGSLVRGMVRSAFGRPKPKRPSSTPFSFTGGMETLPRAMAAAIGDRIRLRSTVRSCSPTGQGVTVDIESDGTRSSEHFDGAILALPLHRMGTLGVPNLTLETTTAVPYPPVGVVALGFDRTDVEHPLDGFGILVPSREPFRILGTLFSSSLFPNRAPGGRVLLTSFTGGRRYPEDARLDRGALIELVLRDLRELIGARGNPSFANVHVLPTAIPQYEASRAVVVDALAEVERGPGPIAFAGNAIAGISVGETIASGQSAAERIAKRLGKS